MFRPLFFALAGLVASAAAAQDKYPSRPIELIVHYAPGGGTDIIMRQLAQIIEPMIGQKVVVVNKPGGGGLLGVAAVTQARPDGYTLGGVANAPITMVPHIQPAPYAPADYVTVTLVDTAPTVLCVRADFPANNGKELIEHMRKNPGKYTYGTDGVGAIIQLSFERIFLKMGVKARPVPFGGAGETLKNFLGGHVDIYGGAITTILPHVKDASSKCLLVTGPERISSVPQAASLSDLGISEVSTLTWHGVIAPKGIAPENLALLEKAFRQAIRSDKFRDYMESRGLKIEATTGAEFRQVIDSEYVAMGQVIKAIGLGK
jgi:tripartite-type tricarboxylate transporter receptor subunit TctC